LKIFAHDTQKSLYQFSKRLAYAYDALRKEFPQWKENDARIAVYVRCSNTAEHVLFSYIFENKLFTKKEWWSQFTYIKSPTDSQINIQKNNYDSFLRVSLVTQYFSCFETFFRILIKKLFPEFKERKFYLICEKILEEFDLKNYQRIFDLYRFIRNSLHENGIISDSHVYPIMYNGEWYRFEKGKSIMVNWLFLCEISMDLEECLNKIIHSKKITDIDSIEDPSSFDANEVTYSYYESM